jgi:cytochrome b561
MPLPRRRESLTLSNARAMSADGPAFLLHCARTLGPSFKVGLGPVTLTIVGEPELLQHVLQKRAAHWVHIALYLVMFLLPLSGWIMDSAYKDAASHPNLYFGLFEWPRLGFIMMLDPVTKEQVHDIFGETHEIAAKILYALVFFHIAGALKHQFLDKDRGLARMGIGRAQA